MAISFPNQSRSYDATRRAVRFWGYDRSMENNFFVSVDALNRIQPNLRFDATEFLRAFDENRERIYAIAAKVYARGVEPHTTSTPRTFDIAVFRVRRQRMSEGSQYAGAFHQRSYGH